MGVEVIRNMEIGKKTSMCHLTLIPYPNTPVTYGNIWNFKTNLFSQLYLHASSINFFCLKPAHCIYVFIPLPNAHAKIISLAILWIHWEHVGQD